jgi:uncharacterized repeat protein (TIGR01451 family)
VTAVQRPALSLAKAALPTTYSIAGDSIVYSYILTNTGNVTLVGPFTVTDDKVTVTVPSTASLAPGDHIDATASHVMAQTDVDAGSVTNLATGHGFFGEAVVDSNQATATVTAVQSPALLLSKSALPLIYTAVGDTVTYTYVLTNSGNVTLVAPFTITDDKVSVLPSIVGVLAPSASISFTAAHVMTQADVAAGTVTNTAVGHGTFGEVQVDSNQATATVTAIHPAISVTKVTDAPVIGVPSGSTVVYTYVVTNTGDEPLITVSLVDDVLGTVVTGETLAIGQSKTFTMSSVLSQSTTNTVTATGSDATQHTVTATATASVDVFAPFTPPDLTITKAASVATAGPGDVVTYTLHYRNLSGDAPVDFTITDTYDSRYMTVEKATGADTSVLGKIVWTIPGPLAVEDGVQTLTYTMRVKATIPSGTTHVNNTVVIFTPDDSNLTNDSATAVVDISETLPFLPFTGGPLSPLSLYALLTAAAGMALLLGLRRRRTE